MKYSILPISEEHIEGFRSAVDSVAKEHLFLALLEAPPMEAVREFVLTNIRFGNPQFVALANNDVVGWCDIIPGTRPVFRHSGVLGMGVIREFRHQGIGTALIKATLDAARSTGLTRIELTVRVDNTPAIRLYEKFDFAVVARLGHHMFVDGEYIDSFLMSLLM